MLTGGWGKQLLNDQQRIRFNGGWRGRGGEGRSNNDSGPTAKVVSVNVPLRIQAVL